MRDLIKMVIVLTVICSSSGFLLAYVHDVTREPREYQLIKFVKEPSIKAVLSDYDNDPVKERVMVTLGKDDKGQPITKAVFPARKGGKVVGLAYDGTAAGYKGPIDVMVGLTPEGKLTGVSVMTQKETPGLGAKIVEPAFTDQFKGQDMSGELKMASEGGKISAISGATVSSVATVEAVKNALQLFETVKKEVL